MTKEEKEFYKGFELKVDKLTVQIQLDKITNEVMRLLESKHGAIIPKQTSEQLQKIFSQAIVNISQ